MSPKMEYKGKDVAEAIRSACEKLNVPRENLDIQVVEPGSAGIFGLCRKKAKVLVSIKGENTLNKELRSEQRRARGTFGLQAEARPFKQKAPAVKREKHPDEAAEESIAISTEKVEGVKRDLQKILELMGFSLDVSLAAEGNKIKAHISGTNLEEVVGSEGQCLDGLQYIMRKIISRRFPEKIKFTLDAGDFRENRSRELEEMSLKMAEEVKQTGKTLSIAALNPAERRIVHMVLQNDSAIRSRSVGDGLFKKILIYVPGKTRKKGPRKKRGSFPRGKDKAVAH